jgi:hypothetical protein
MEVLYRLSYRGTLSWGREDSNLRRRSRQIYSLLPLAARAHPRPRPRKHSPERPIMVANATDFSTEPGKGFEPPTCRLQGGCSTAELPGRIRACQHFSWPAFWPRAPLSSAPSPTIILAGAVPMPPLEQWQRPSYSRSTYIRSSRSSQCARRRRASRPHCQRSWLSRHSSPPKLAAAGRAPAAMPSAMRSPLDLPRP